MVFWARSIVTELSFLRQRRAWPAGYALKTIFSETRRSAILKSPSIAGWYRILRAHFHWTAFQAIRYALWLAR
jgi:hypothetical protein